MGVYSTLTNEIVDFGDKKHYVRDHAPTKITLHHMAVVNADPVAVAKGHRDSNRQASANYYIGSDGKIVGAVSEEFGAWTSSSKTNDKQAITVEISNSKGRPNWEISDKAYAAVIALCADICMRYGITPHYTGNSDGTLTLHCMFAKTACVPTFSEVLTRYGWKRIDAVRIGDEIACADLDNLRITFEEIYDKVDIRRQDTYTNNELTATKDHRMVYRTQGQKYWRIDTYNNLLSKGCNVYIPLAGQIDARGLQMSDDMLRFMAATQADGHYMSETNKDGEQSFYGVEFHFRKERKIERLKSIVDAIGLKYKEGKRSDGTVAIRIYNQDDVNIVTDICEKWLCDKAFTWEWLNLSKEQAELFLDEIMLWDGCVAGKKYSSEIQSNLDIVNAIAAVNMKGSRVIGDNVQFRESPYITLGDETKRNSKSGSKRMSEVTCVSVKTGVFLMRQDGKTFIVGNCPGNYLKTLHETGQVELNIKQSMVPTPQPTPSQDIDKTIWDYLMSQIGNACGVAGLMGNIQAESGLKPNNLENSKEKASGFTDATYTQAVDDGTYANFAGDAFGYGLCQWTSSGRKSALLSLKQSKGCSIADVNLQLEHLMNELNGSYKNVLKVLKNATSVREASDIVLTKFEIPRDQSEAVKVRRADMGQKFYEKFSGEAFKPYIARITAAALNVRKGAGITYPIVMQVKKGSAYTIVEKVGEWGRLKSGVGWICLDYTQFVRYV